MKNLYLLFCLSTFAVQGQIVPPYYDDFESGALGWYNTTLSGSSWELGIPNFGTTSGAHSGNNAWDISLDSAYKNNTLCYLYSPQFDFSTTTNAILSFWQNYNTEVQWDATLLQYTTDTGATWKILGIYDSVPSINWISYDLIGDWGWWGTSNCWALSSIKLDSVYGYSNVQFRFQFTSDASIFYDGVTIDDFSIYTPPNNDAAIASIISPQKNAQQPNPLAKANVANLGTIGLLSVPVGVIVNGGIPNYSIYNGLLSSNQADSFAFGSYTAPNGFYTICFFTALFGDANPLNDTLCCVIYNGVSSIAELNNESFIIYPNPSGGNLIQIRNLVAGKNLSIQIIDALGNVVYVSSGLSDESITLHENLAAGIYLVRINDGLKSYCKKLIIE